MNEAFVGGACALVLLFQMVGHSREVDRLESHTRRLEAQIERLEIEVGAYRSGVIEGQLR